MNRARLRRLLLAEPPGLLERALLKARRLTSGASSLSDTPPLYSHDERFGVVWSPKSACTTVLLWFLQRGGHLERAAAFGAWPHEYRARVLLPSAAYREGAAACDLRAAPFLRVIRDPARRAVSSWSAAFLIPDVDAAVRQFLGIGPHAPYSFSDFVGFLEDGHVALDIHLAPQRSTIERHARQLAVVNVDTTDLIAGIQAFERDNGLSPTDFGAGTLLAREIARVRSRHHVPRFDTTDDWSARPLTREGVDGRWPSYAALLPAPVRTRLENVYAVDYDAYRPHLETPS